MRGLALALFIAGPALAGPGVPGPDYFSGTYQRVGRDGATPPALIDDLVRIVPLRTSVELTFCEGPPIALGFNASFEQENLMVGPSMGGGVECLFHNNGFNLPILTCRVQDGARFTLWRLADVPPDAPLACGS